MAAPAWFTGVAGTVASRANTTLTIPATAVVDDILFWCMEQDSGSAGNAMPAGWTNIFDSTSAGGARYTVYWHRVASGEPGTTVQCTHTTTFTQATIEVWRGCYRGGSPISGTPTSALGGASAATAPTCTTLHPDCLVVTVGSNIDNGVTHTSTGSERRETNCFGIYDTPQAAAGPTGTKTVTMSVGTGDNFAGIVALRANDPTFRSRYFATAANAGVTGAEPAGTIQGDMMLAKVIVDSNATGFSPPAGWTTLQPITPSSTPQYRYWLGYVSRGASAPSMAWTWAGAFYYELHILTYANTDPTTPVEAYTPGNNVNVTGHGTQPGSFDPPSITTLGPGRLVVCGGDDWVGNIGGWTPSTGYTLRTDNTNGNDVGMADKLVTAQGAEDPSRWANGATSASGSDLWSFTLALVPTTSTPSVPNSGTTYASGTYGSGTYGVRMVGDTTAPGAINVTSSTAAKISRVSGKDATNVTFTADEAFVEYEIRRVSSGSDTRAMGTQVETAVVASRTSHTTTVTDAELEAAGGTEGGNLLKVFVKDAAGNWSL